jgi:hypothetical protein
MQISTDCSAKIAVSKHIFVARGRSTGDGFGAVAGVFDGIDIDREFPG